MSKLLKCLLLSSALVLSLPLGYFGASVFYIPESEMTRIPAKDSPWEPGERAALQMKRPCWEVTQATGPETTLSAKLLEDCASRPVEAILSESSWSTEPIFLPIAASPGQLGNFPSEARIVLSEELVSNAGVDLEGGLLFLPDSVDGSGYLVAGWRELSENGEELSAVSGLSIQASRVAQNSVQTSAGRIHAEPPAPSPADDDVSLMSELPDLALTAVMAE